MSLLNSLFTGVSGLRNHQTMMDVIGDNIANVNSLGFKGSRVSFSDTFSQFVRYGTNPTDGSGGTNTFQVGLGMQLNSIDRNWNQGTFERTGISTDLALQGSGMFVMENNGQRTYTRAGAFQFDANGTLVSSQNGAKVMGKMASTDGVIPAGNNLEKISINPNIPLPAIATTKVNWGGNLSSSSKLTRSEKCIESGNINKDLTTTAPGNEKTIVSDIYDDNGNKYKLTATYTKQSTPNTFNLTYTMRDSAGSDVTLSPAATNIPVVFDGTTEGKMLSLNGTTPPVALNLKNDTMGINFNVDPTFVTENANATTLSSSVDENRTPNKVSGTLTVFDSYGNSHSLTVNYTRTDSGWNWNASVPKGEGELNGGSGSLTFNTDGSIKTISPSNPTLSFIPANGAAAQNIQLNFGKDLEGITQNSANSSISPLGQNGMASASLLNLNVDSTGKVVGVYSNGESKDLAQIMLANFTNNNGLINAGDNMFTKSANSGEPTISSPGELSKTTIQSGSLEQSNVDLSTEFTKMIVAQRGFQANARVVTMSDNLLQEITSLVR